ncbi:BN159_2729 family protein [Streptomyces sp. NPDC001142]
MSQPQANPKISPPGGGSALLTPSQRMEIARLLGEGTSASDELIMHLAESVRDVRDHTHPQGEDLYCSNLTAYMGERAALLLRRLLDTEAEVAWLRARSALDTAAASAPRADDSAPELTDLERQALAWDQSCARARQVAESISQTLAGHPEFQAARADGDQVLVALHVTDQAQWARWRRHFGITHNTEQPLPYATCGNGFRDGVRVSVVAYDVPQVRARSAAVSALPFQFEGIVYDLAIPQRDAAGDVWTFRERRAVDGMPLLSMQGRTERCSLANVVRLNGPLSPVRTTPSADSCQGGDAA